MSAANRNDALKERDRRQRRRWRRIRSGAGPDQGLAAAWHRRLAIARRQWLAIGHDLLASHQDPRYYRFGIAINAFAVAFIIQFVFQYCLHIRQTLVIGGVVFILGLSGAKIAYQYEEFDSFKRPSLKDNLNVLLNKMYSRA